MVKNIDENFWLGRKVFITGHTGFKGSWLSSILLKMGAKISGLSLKEPASSPSLFDILNFDRKINDMRGSINNINVCREALDDCKPEVLIHLAAQPIVRKSYKNPVNTYETNIMGTVNILESARHIKSIKSVLVITSDKCYENNKVNRALIENDPLGGYDPYSSSKACAEHIASSFYRSFFNQSGVGLATARAGNVIGGGDWAEDRLIPDIIRSWLNDSPVIIRHPNAIRPWQHVIEPLIGYLKLTQNLYESPEEFSSGWNFGPNYNTEKTVLDCVKICQQFWGENAKVVVKKDNEYHETKSLRLDTSKADRLLALNNKISIEESIKITLSWYKKYYDKSENILEFTNEQIARFIG